MKKSHRFILCQETALAEAALQLMRAQKLARKRKNPEELVMVAAGWMELSGRLGSEHQDEPEDVKQFGFIGVEVKNGGPTGPTESDPAYGIHK